VIPALQLKARSFFPSLRASVLAATSVAITAGMGFASAQNPTVPPPPPTTTTSADGQTTTTTSTTVDSTGKPVQSVTTSHTFGRGKKKNESKQKVGQLKNDKKAIKKEQKNDALAGVDAKLPDKQLYDKAMLAVKKGHFDVARLDLQTMLNTYPDSQYQMRAKLAIADSWYKEGGTAALTQAESEYRDFCVFFPNAPEAAEAQMRIGDIYFKQMDKPDRDYSKALHAEEEYRRMIADYSDSKLVPDAKQRLREVQEVLASREADIAGYYATRENWAAVIARYQTVIDTYPLYSHVDDAYIGLGDAYEAQARYIRSTKLPEGPKAKLEALYDGRAADAYREVVLNHAAAPHVEDAKDRLAAMNLPIPTPTHDQLAASEALENSRRNYKVTDRMRFLIMHEPDTVLTAQTGDPSLTDPKPTIAPAVLQRVSDDFKAALNPNAAVEHAAVPTPAADSGDAATTAAPPASNAPLAFTPVPDSSGSANSGEMTAPPAGGSTPGGASMGVEILPSSSGVRSSAPPPAPPINPLVESATPASLPAAEGKPDPDYGLKAVAPKDNSALPPIEKASEAPDRPNTIDAKSPAAQAVPAKGKAKAPEFDKSEESSSKHKKKKGIKKIIPPNPL
jgi:outer membrane protein assembly factor BamD